MGWGSREYPYTVYPPVTTVAPPARGLRFSREEYTHILLAVLALTAAFTLSFLSPLGGAGLVTVKRALQVFLGSAVAVVTGFLLHELMHKAVAQRYGAWAEFRSNRMGLLFAVITGLFGIVFAAPGAVYIAGPLSREQNGKVSIAGPLTNFVLGLAFTGAWIGARLSIGGEIGDYLRQILFLTAYINVFLGGFNMVPIPPLDGSKVLRWNPVIWGATIAAIAATFLAFFIPGFVTSAIFGP